MNTFLEGLGQKATKETSNEITTIPELLKTLALQGAIVTIDAMGTQTKIAETIRKGEADSVLCVKDKHLNLLDSIMFAKLGPEGALRPFSTDEVTATKPSHGRLELAAAGPTTWGIGSTSMKSGRKSAASPSWSASARRTGGRALSARITPAGSCYDLTVLLPRMWGDRNPSV